MNSKKNKSIINLLFMSALFLYFWSSVCFNSYAVTTEITELNQAITSVFESPLNIDRAYFKDKSSSDEIEFTISNSTRVYGDLMFYVYTFFPDDEQIYKRNTQYDFILNIVNSSDEIELLSMGSYSVGNLPNKIRLKEPKPFKETIVSGGNYETTIYLSSKSEVLYFKTDIETKSCKVVSTEYMEKVYLKKSLNERPSYSSITPLSFSVSSVSPKEFKIDKYTHSLDDGESNSFYIVCNDFLDFVSHSKIIVYYESNTPDCSFILKPTYVSDFNVGPSNPPLLYISCTNEVICKYGFSGEKNYELLPYDILSSNYKKEYNDVKLIDLANHFDFGNTNRQNYPVSVHCISKSGKKSNIFQETITLFLADQNRIVSMTPKDKSFVLDSKIHVTFNFNRKVSSCELEKGSVKRELVYSDTFGYSMKTTLGDELNLVDGKNDFLLRCIFEDSEKKPNPLVQNISFYYDANMLKPDFDITFPNNENSFCSREITFFPNVDIHHHSYQDFAIRYSVYIKNNSNYILLTNNSVEIGKSSISFLPPLSSDAAKKKQEFKIVAQAQLIPKQTKVVDDWKMTSLKEKLFVYDPNQRKCLLENDKTPPNVSISKTTFLQEDSSNSLIIEGLCSDDTGCEEVIYNIVTGANTLCEPDSSKKASLIGSKINIRKSISSFELDDKYKVCLKGIDGNSQESEVVFQIYTLEDIHKDTRTPQSECGDSFCDFDEDLDNCPQDCYYCGDSVCTQGYEDHESCPSDCKSEINLDDFTWEELKNQFPELDSDADGLLDWWEKQYFDCRTCVDSNDDPDRDDLTNIEEFQFETDPNKKDTDGGDFWDSEEIACVSDPLDPGDYCPNDYDQDNDGMPNVWEKKYFSHPTKTRANDDYDDDGYTNLEEFLEGTDPTDPDSKPSNALAVIFWIFFILIILGLIGAIVFVVLKNQKKEKNTNKKDIPKSTIIPTQSPTMTNSYTYPSQQSYFNSTIANETNRILYKKKSKKEKEKIKKDLLKEVTKISNEFGEDIIPDEYLHELKSGIESDDPELIDSLSSIVLEKNSLVSKENTKQEKGSKDDDVYSKLNKEVSDLEKEKVKHAIEFIVKKKEFKKESEELTNLEKIAKDKQDKTQIDELTKKKKELEKKEKLLKEKEKILKTLDEKKLKTVEETSKERMTEIKNSKNPYVKLLSSHFEKQIKTNKNYEKEIEKQLLFLVSTKKITKDEALLVLNSLSLKNKFDSIKEKITDVEKSKETEKNNDKKNISDSETKKTTEHKDDTKTLKKSKNNDPDDLFNM